MNQQTESLANIWANRRAEDDKLGITYTFSEKALQAFAEKVQEAHTQSVIQLCAKTINDNLNEQDRKRRNKIEMLELFVIIVVMAAWAHWWYTQLHWYGKYMNERIKQLAEQSGFQLDELPDNILLPLENFAESIVKEVISIAEDTKNYNRTIYTTHDVDRAKALMADLVKAIKQQLG